MTNFFKHFQSSIYLMMSLLLVGACQSQVEKPQASTTNKFTDSMLIEIRNFQDTRNTEGLLTFFDNKNPTYRLEAALALGSVQDTSALPRLGYLLDDENTKVRQAAAYALGQIGDSTAIEFLIKGLQGEDSLFVKKEMLEALGKVITQPKIALLYNRKVDTKEEKEGMAWGLYRAGLRNVYDGLSTELAVGLLDTSNSYATRLGAAHFLARTRGVVIEQYEDSIIASATMDKAVNVRMAATTALQHLSTEKVRKVLMENIFQDDDYRVRVNALRSMANYDFQSVSPTAFEALNDQNINVAITAADLIGLKSAPADAEVIKDLGLNHDNPRIKASLLGTALKLNPGEALIHEVEKAYNESGDPYYKAGLLTALSSSLKSYEFIITQTFSATHPAITTAGIAALAELRAGEDFPEQLKPAFADIFKQAMRNGDIAMVAILSPLLSDTTYHFREEYDSVDFLYEARSKLSLPKDNEALQELNKTIAYFEGNENVPETRNEYNHPIDWTVVKGLARDQKVLVKTEKGDITMRMLVEEAPGSVANFIALAGKGYFDSKNFHRVVPNFVIQGGCNRGDGYGGESYSIRSEFANLRYQEGSVGMASAGKDTEGTQWFITHSPTPHLDGRYTIFAQVTEGMDIVHHMEVGDKIISVTLLPKVRN